MRAESESKKMELLEEILLLETDTLDRMMKSEESWSKIETNRQRVVIKRVELEIVEAYS